MTLDYFYGQTGELFSFFRIPKALFQEQRFQDLSTDAKTLYGILLDRMSLSVKNEWFDKKGRVFIIFTIEDVKRTLRCADNKATRLLRELEKFGLIERKRRGQGKPCLVYVKNFSAESSKESVKNRDNDDSCGSKIACQDPVKSRGIKKKENKTEMNNTNKLQKVDALQPLRLRPQRKGHSETCYDPDDQHRPMSSLGQLFSQINLKKAQKNKPHKAFNRFCEPIEPCRAYLLLYSICLILPATACRLLLS